MKHALTRRQAEVFQVIRKYIKQHGISPSYQDICAGAGLVSKSQAYDMVKRLEVRGYITRLRGKSRSISLVPDERDEMALLRMIRDASNAFVSVQEQHRAKYDSNPSDPDTAALGSRVGVALNNLRELVRGEV